MAALVWRGSLERGMPAQASSSSSYLSSKLRVPALNSPRVASKRDINISKLIYYIWYIKIILPNFPDYPNSPESESRVFYRIFWIIQIFLNPNQEYFTEFSG
ncbi:hypothetical protein AVEN_3179-1 [Araneus ventricosus]|uniref:Uncharacterized protein n=1 Tax=Araneus ventricosus TaxID=182803 RepID=A0A4Y2KHD1_ARAVE|nr:hypothetical protein AVEN_3179-1 [Araneus ventricosus]